MGHYEKWTRLQCAQVLYHNLHMPGEKSNEGIDYSKRHLNYNLAPHNVNSYEFLKKRIDEIFCLNRKDVNVLSGWVITLPRDVKPEDERKFFEATYEFLEKRYGKENVVDAWVHRDESGRDHIHFDWVPAVWDKKKERWKVSAKETVDRKDMKAFHPDLEKFVSDRLGYRCSIMTGELSNRPDLTLEQFKSLKDIEKSLELARIEQGTLIKDINDLKSELNEIKGKIDDFETYERKAEEVLTKIETVATKRNKKIVIPAEYWEEFKTLRTDVRASRAAINFVRNSTKSLEKALSDSMENAERYKISKETAESIAAELKKKNDRIEPDLNRVLNAFRSSPELLEHFRVIDEELQKKSYEREIEK